VAKDWSSQRSCSLPNKVRAGSFQLAQARVHPAGAECTTLGARLPVAVLAIVQGVQHRQPAKGHAVIQAQLAAGLHHTRHRLLQHRSPQGHVFVIGLVSRQTACGKVRHLRPESALHPAGVIVLYLVVVPGHDPRAGSVHGLQINVAFVQRTARAVVVQGQGSGRGHTAHSLAAATVLVDVVAQEHDGIEVFSAHVPVSAVKAVLPMLAGRIGQAQLLRPPHPARGRCACAR